MSMKNPKIYRKLFLKFKDSYFENCRRKSQIFNSFSKMNHDEGYPKFLDQSLREADPELFELIEKEKYRQKSGLELIASENFTSVSVLECLGSCLTNKYSEGRPGFRYYGGTQIIDQIEILCEQRALEAFGLCEKIWGVNVQPYSGSPANFEVFTALLKPHDRIMGLDLPDGGHLSHGFMTKNRRISATSIFWESMPYKVHQDTGLIDFETLRILAKSFSPKIIVAGYSCYPRHVDFQKFREICDEVGALLLADISHISGIVLAGYTINPFEFAHVVVTTSHKLLRGPRAACIFYRKDKGPNFSDLQAKINSSVFPGLQGGPHNNAIAALATTFKQAQTEEYKSYIRRVLENCKVMQKCLSDRGYEMVTGGSDNHLILVNLKNKGLNGSIAELALEQVNISVNKNACHGDKSVINPSGIRIGTPALTTRNFNEDSIPLVVDLIDRCLKITYEFIKSHDIKTASEFKIFSEHKEFQDKISQIKFDVEELSSKFPFPANFKNL